MLERLIVRIIIITFFFTSLGPLPDASAQTLIDLPAPGMMVNKSGPYQPLQLKGILVNIKNPLRFDFLVDKGDSHLYGQPLKDEIIRSAKYFLTCLTVPEDDLWVNLSPYEKDRIVPDNFGITLMGKDLLEQDYLLKQMMASLSYPENDLGRRFWQKVYRRSYELYGTTNIPINTFNKVWILPKSAQVYAQGNSAFVVSSKLDVMLEADYKAFVHHDGFSQQTGAYSQVLRDVILPELRQEVNEGKNFAVVRQVFNAMILATWYKRHLKDSLLGRMYVGQNKVSGVDIADKNAKEKIFRQYLKAYKKCVYNYIKEDYDPLTQQTVPRKYASGGMWFVRFGKPDSAMYEEVPTTQGMSIGPDLARATIDVTATNNNGAMVAFPPMAEITHNHPFYFEDRKQDAAMIASKTGTMMRRMLLSSVVLGAVAVSAPSVEAQQNMRRFDYVEISSQKPMWPWYLGYAILGIGITAGGAVFLRRISSRKPKVPPIPRVRVEQRRAISPPVLPPITGSALDGIVLPPPPASSGEKKILHEDLLNLRKVADGEIIPPPSIPAEKEFSQAGPGTQNLLWMDAGALLGSALSVYWGGGLLGVLAINPVTARALYVAQKWLHEFFHMSSARVSYPIQGKGAFNGNNLKGNLSLGQWFKSLIPFTPVQRAQVNLPFAASEGGWWNKTRNQIVAKSGLMGTMALALSAGYMMGLTPLLVPLVLSALTVLNGSIDSGDLGGSQDADQGRFGCGIIGFVKRVPLQGVKTKDLKPWLAWFFDGVESSTARGGQQAGISASFSDANGSFLQLDEKITKEKRNWMIWRAWDRGPVLYRNMINDLHGHFYRALPKKIVPVYNYVQFGVLKILGHVRFATNGDMVEVAAHPHSSAKEEREQWVYDAVQKSFKKVIRIFQVTSAFNGDHDYSKIGIPYRQQLFAAKLGNSDMRRFFSAAGYMYYGKKVTQGYLKKTVSDGRKYDQKVKTNYDDVLAALHRKGYVDFWGRVDHQFKGVDEEFKSWFPEYQQGVFDEIECALFGLPPGDAPIIPLEQHLLLTQGSWFASVRNAHIMANHRDAKEAMDDILFEQEGRAVGRVFSEVYDQLEPYISRRGYNPQDPETVRSLNDLYVKDEETAKSLGLEDQYRMIRIFKDMLDKRIQQEALQPTAAGEVFRQWEQKWQEQGEDARRMRRLIIDVAVEKFFTADNVAATKEFAERSEGSHGLFMNNSLDDSITLYQNNQDVVLGINQATGDYGFASDPRSLKSLGPNGERFEEIMHLKEGEVVNLSFSPSGKIVIRSWMRINGKWRETPKENLMKRFYPTAEIVDGVENKYYSPPPVQYDNPLRVVQEDLENTSGILARASEELEDPRSFNRQSTDNLGRLIKRSILNKGHARLVLIGFDNSFELSNQFKEITKDLVSDSRLAVEVIDANKFNDSPSEFNIKPDDIVMVVSKSGATFSTKLSMRLIQSLVGPQNVFCMTARIDSVLNSMLGQGLRPGDPFTKRIFITGDFYPAETPVVSDVLLMFQLQQLAVNLALALKGMDGLNFSDVKLKKMAKVITEQSITMSQELTGFDINGHEYANADKSKKAIGAYLGKVALETFIRNWFMNLFVFGVLEIPSALLLSQYVGGGVLGALVNVIWINYVVRFLATEFYRKMIGRPKYGVHAPFQLFVAATELIHKTQRNFFSRIMTNKFTSIGPLEPLGGDPKTDFTANFASAVKPGDVILRFYLAHRSNEGRMGVNQTAYPQTEVFGPTIKGKAEIKDVVINVPQENDAAKGEISLMDNTIGFLGQMLAAKTIGVEMSRWASFNGRLFNRAYTFSSAGVFTTQINPISEEASHILRVDASQVAFRDPGGITMNSRLMQLNVTGDTQNRPGLDDHAMPSEAIINGVVPQVSGIVTVTPQMLKNMLATGYLN